VLHYGKAGPGPEGSVMIVDFTLDGVPFTALNGGPVMKFSGAVSFVIDCKTQQEIDHYWDRLGAGGQYQQCGWLIDRFGLTWQVVPTRLIELMSSSDAAQNQRVTEAMMKMVKLDIATLENAAAGASASAHHEEPELDR
jgi:predicted 3-demethylubiquinone-9 3-methyltransferase (glyoxalase superfamily)